MKKSEQRNYGERPSIFPVVPAELINAIEAQKKSFAAQRHQAFRELRLQRVTRSFGSTIALNGLDLTIQSGEFIALLGPSGCGKSTALNCLAGLLPLTEGSIWLDQQRIDQLPPERRGFCMVFQNYALFPHMTVRRNVGFGFLMRCIPP